MSSTTWRGCSAPWEGQGMAPAVLLPWCCAPAVGVQCRNLTQVQGAGTG